MPTSATTMRPKPMQSTPIPTAKPACPSDDLVHLLSTPVGSPSWANGMRGEIQVCLAQPEVDRDYVGYCLKLLLHSGGWRLLNNVKGVRFSSFVQVCNAERPHGLGLKRAEVDALLGKQDN